MNGKNTIVLALTALAAATLTSCATDTGEEISREAPALTFGRPDGSGTASRPLAAPGGFYKYQPIFSTRPSEKKSLQTIGRFGPVGMGIELHQPAFVMKIKNIEEGPPAAATGELRKGQIIETINGRKLADIDPRIQLGRIVAAAEATDGVVKFMVKDKPDAAAEEVIVEIPVLGAYSRTWPLNCPKSDKIVRNFADGSDYLSVEAGGFGTRNPPGWQSPWYVMKQE